MTCEESIKWLENLHADLGQSQYQGLWHYEQALDETIELLKSVEFPCKRKFKSMTVSKWCDPKKVPKKYILVDVTNDEEYAKKRFCCNKCKQVYEEGER